jgi:hypothetical protein
MAKANSQAENFGKNTLSALKGQIAGAFSVAALVGFTKSVVDHVDRIGDLAEQYNLTTDAVQKLMILSGRSGVEFEKFGNLLLKISELRAKAMKPGKDGEEARGQFGKFGVDYKGPLLDVATQLSVALGGKTDDATALDMVSTKGAKALSVLKGIQDIGRVSIVNAAEVANVSSLSDAVGDLWRNVKGFAATSFFSPIGALIDAGGNPALARERYQQRLRDSLKKPEAVVEPVEEPKKEAVKKANKAVEAIRFQSSASGNITAAGGYFLGSGQTAAMDIAKQALDLAKRQLDANARTARSTEKIANKGVTVIEDPTDP